MANTADILSRAYSLPQMAPPTTQPVGYQAQPTPFDDGLTYETGIASVQGATEDYYKKIGMLKSFMQEAQSNYNIDVRVPDYSKPISIRLNQMYQKALADIKAQGTLLKNSQSQFAATNYGQNVAFQGNQDPTATPMASMRAGVDYVNKEVNPLVVEINNKLQQQFYGKSYDEAMVIYKKAIENLKQYAKNNPSEAASIERSLNALTPPVQQEKIFQERAPKEELSKGDQAKVKAAELSVKRIANQITGTSDQYKLSKTEKGPNGEALYVMQDTDNTRLGAGNIERWLHNPITGTTVIKVKNKDGSISTIDVTGRDPITFLKELGTVNPRYNVDGTALDIYAQDSGLINPETGDLNPEVLKRKDMEQFQTRRNEELNAFKKSKTAAIHKKIEDQLDQLEPTGVLWTQTGWDYSLKNGKDARIKRGNKGYYIDNFNDAFPNATKQQKQLYDDKPLSKDQVLEFLRKNIKEEAWNITDLSAVTSETPAALSSLKPKFKVDSASKTENIHPWAIDLGNKIYDAVGDTTITFNSAFRTKERNKEVGGKSNSFHLDGAALDIKPADWKKIPEAVKKKLIADYQLDVIDEGDHIHIEPKNRKVLTDYKESLDSPMNDGTTPASKTTKKPTLTPGGLD